MPPSPSLDALLDQILREPPEDPDELRHLLADVPPSATRAKLIARLRDPEVTRGAASVAGHALAVLGLGDALNTIVELLGDDTTPEHSRQAAVQALASLPPETLQEVIPRLPQKAADALFVLPLIEMVASVQADPATAVAIPQTLRMLAPELRLGWLRELAVVRRSLGVRAADLYRDALADHEIAGDERLREPMLLALIEEADEAGSALLQSLRARASKKLRAPFQSALVRLETARAAGCGSAPTATGVEALVSNVDGQGAFVALVSFRNPDGTFTLANACARLTEDLRSGFFESRSTREERDRLVRDFNADDIELIPAPPGEVATLIAEAVARTKVLGHPIPADVRRSVEFIERIERVALPPNPPAREIDLRTVAHMLARPIFDSWFFDEVDQEAFGVPPMEGELTERWCDAALAALARSPVRARVIAMARYTAHRSRWKGLTDEASVWTTLADGAERDFARSPLAMLMLTKTFEPATMTERAEQGSRTGLAPFAELFPDEARRETRAMRLANAGDVPEGTYELHEFYCIDPACDCNRVLFKVYSPDAGRHVATINHGFSARAARADGLEQTFVDPLHANAFYADALCEIVDDMLRHDRAYLQRLKDHYAMVKRAVGAKVIAHAPARSERKPGPNEPCPCGSGKKYKKCCGR
jgi:hypothetical protein